MIAHPDNSQHTVCQKFFMHTALVSDFGFMQNIFRLLKLKGDKLINAPYKLYFTCKLCLSDDRLIISLPEISNLETFDCQ